MLPSLHDSNKMLSKSKLRVSNTPITCKPTTGSPWKGMLVACTSCVINRNKVIKSTERSPEIINSCKRLNKVYILYMASFIRWSLVSCVLVPTHFSNCNTQATSLAW